MLQKYLNDWHTELHKNEIFEVSDVSQDFNTGYACRLTSEVSHQNWFTLGQRVLVEFANEYKAGIVEYVYLNGFVLVRLDESPVISGGMLDNDSTFRVNSVWKIN